MDGEDNKGGVPQASGTEQEEEPDGGKIPDEKDQDKVLEEKEEDEVLDESFEVVNNPIAFTADAPALAAFKDHFTLQIPSSTIRYREKHSAARVIEGSDSQFVLEETYDPDTKKHSIEIRKIHNTSEGVRFLRLSYALVTAFFTGFLFVFCLQVLLYLVLDLALESGATTHQEEANWGKALGAILGFPALVYGFSSGLVLAGAYIADTCRGHYLIQNFTFRGIDPVTVEWMFFAFFLGLPVLVMSVTLLVGTDDWWAITLLFWFSCVLAFFVIFCAHVLLYEFRACWDVIQKYSDDDNDNFFHVLARCITLRQISTYSGLKRVSYLSRGTIVDSEYTDKKRLTESEHGDIIPESYQEQVTRMGKFTLSKRFSTDGGWGLYEPLEGNEQRVFTLDDARDVRPYVTSHTWNLEKIFCRPKDSRYIAIISGPGAITKSQMKSSMACSLIGTVLIFFLIFAGLMYLGMGIVFTMFIVAIGVIIALPTFKSTYRLYELGKDFMHFDLLGKGDEESEVEAAVETEDGIKASEAVYLVQENYRVSRPTILMCWTAFLLEVAVFFVYPFWALFTVGNYPMAILFIIVAGISGLRYYINASIVLEETGSMALIGGGSEEEVWKNQSRMNEIVGNITRGRSRGAWMSVLGALGFAFVGIFLGAVGTEVDSLATWDTPYTYNSAYEYIQKDSLRYPTCTLTAGASFDGPLQTMAGTSRPKICG